MALAAHGRSFADTTGSKRTDFLVGTSRSTIESLYA